LVTCGIVYGLGFYLGRATPDRRAGAEQRTVRLPVTSTPPPEGPTARAAKEFPSFYETLPAGERPGTERSAAEPPAAATPTTTLALIARVPAAAKPSSPTTTIPARLPSTTAPVADARPAAVPTTVRAVVTTTTSAPPTPPTTVTPARSSESMWTVEAAPTRSRAEADALRATLRQRGYDVMLVQVKRDGDTWYRLRVGRYATPAQANAMMRRLRDNEGVTHAFVASE
jgi:cell division protein FtsN